MAKTPGTKRVTAAQLQKTWNRLQTLQTQYNTAFTSFMSGITGARSGTQTTTASRRGRPKAVAAGA